MVNLNKPKVKVVTKDGECDLNISLDINININSSNGNIRAEIDNVQKLEDKDESNFAIPDFKKSNKIKFGKTDNGENK